MQKSKRAQFVAIVIFIVVVIVFWMILPKSEEGEVSVTTDKQEYFPGDNLTIIIDNNTAQSISFSSCYPYFFERQINTEWQTYEYENCEELNKTGEIIPKKNIKTFEVIIPELSELKEGSTHRLMIPLCKNCKNTEEYFSNLTVYSNEFLINR